MDGFNVFNFFIFFRLIDTVNSLVDWQCESYFGGQEIVVFLSQYPGWIPCWAMSDMSVHNGTYPSILFSRVCAKLSAGYPQR